MQRNLHVRRSNCRRGRSGGRIVHTPATGHARVKCRNQGTQRNLHVRRSNVRRGRSGGRIVHTPACDAQRGALRTAGSSPPCGSTCRQSLGKNNAEHAENDRGRRCDGKCPFRFGGRCPELPDRGRQTRAGLARIRDPSDSGSGHSAFAKEVVPDRSAPPARAARLRARCRAAQNTEA